MPALLASPRVRISTLVLLAVVAACSPDSTPTAPRAPRRASPLLAPTLVVTNTDDSGPGSLRQAITDATGGEIIQFDASIAGGTIVLSNQLFIDKALAIEGPQTGGMTISGNLSSRVILIGFGGDVVLRNLSVVNGRQSNGAGIATVGNLLLDHSLVANNEGEFGGGVFADGPASVTLVNSTVSGNVARKGGGIYSPNGQPVALRNSTVAMNTATEAGGGLYVNAPLSLRNTIIAQNKAIEAGVTNNCEFFNTPKTVTGINIMDDYSCADPGDGVVKANPGLGPLASNGGPTMTHALLLGSRAIDGGVQCTEATDQRYVTRTQGASCDVGAYEFTAFVSLTLTITPNAVVNPKTGELTVTGTVVCPRSYEVAVDVSASQSQRVTGRFPTLVQALGGTGLMPCAGTTPWSVTLTPQTGRFENGSATATADTFRYPPGFLPAVATSSLKVFAVK